VLTEASTLSDHLIKWRCGSDIGYGIMEYGIGTGYRKYKKIPFAHFPNLTGHGIHVRRLTAIRENIG
jgi:hypothetical protein